MLPASDLRAWWARLSPRRARGKTVEREPGPADRWTPLRERDFERSRREALIDQALLEELSAPYKTSVQLRRLARMSRRPDEPFSFAVLGDVEPGRFWVFRKLFNVPGAFERQLRDLQDQPVDFSIQLGDMVSRGLRRNYIRFLETLRGADPRRAYLTVIGNHDRYSPHHRSDASVYTAAFGKTNYFFDHGGVRFVCLDTSARELTRRQLRWLDRVLDVPRLKVVFTHVPPACLRRWTDFGAKRGLGGFRRGAAEFAEIVSCRRVARVYMGHIHAFGVQDYRGVRYVLTGGGGSPLFPSGAADKFHHYIVARFEGGGISETVHTLEDGSFEVPDCPVVFSP